MFHSSNKIISVLLLISFVLVNILGCSQQKPNNSDTTNKIDDVTQQTTTAIPTDADMLAKSRAQIKDSDFGGYEFTFLVRSDLSPQWYTRDVFSAEQNGDPINDAVYERNSIVEEKLNIKIREKPVDTPPSDSARKFILAGTNECDVLTDGLVYLTKTLAAPGYLVDFAGISTINLSGDWWDNMLSDGLSIKNKVYYATGDISIMDNYGTWCFLFNKDIIRDNNLDNPYPLVDDNKWTLAKMYEMAKSAAKDLDGDGIMGDWDQYGFLSESFNTYALWSSTGEKIVTKNKNDLPEITMYNQRSEAVLKIVLDLQIDTSTTMTSDRHKRSNVAANLDPVDVMFKGGYSLFIFGGMWLISEYRDSEVDFGILPAPKYMEDQESYYSTYSYQNCTAYSIPITATELEMTGQILEAMAIISKYTLTPAYYDVSLVGKYLRDDESKGMIDLVLSTRNYDLGSLFDFGGLFTIFGSMYTAKSYDLTSKYIAAEEKAQNQIQTLIDSIE